VALLIRSWTERNEGLRGMHVFLTRHSHSNKSRMEVDYVDDEIVPWYRDLEVPDPNKAMDLTWSKMGALRPKKRTAAAESVPESLSSRAPFRSRVQTG